MDNSHLIKRAIADALATTLYIFLISQIMIHGEQLFGKANNNLLAPMVFLLMFVFSALLTGFLVLGKPLMMYLDGQKKEALRLLFYTGAFLFVIMFAGFLFILAWK